MSPANEKPVTVIRVVCERHKRPRVIGVFHSGEKREATTPSGAKSFHWYPKPHAPAKHLRALAEQRYGYMKISEELAKFIEVHGADTSAYEVAAELTEPIPGLPYPCSLEEAREEAKAMVRVLEYEFSEWGVSPDSVEVENTEEPRFDLCGFTTDVIHLDTLQRRALREGAAESPEEVEPGFFLTCPSCAESKSRYQRFTAFQEPLEKALDALAGAGKSEVTVKALKGLYDFSARRLKMTRAEDS